jgi:hypothetical protein
MECVRQQFLGRQRQHHALAGLRHHIAVAMPPKDVRVLSE